MGFGIHGNFTNGKVFRWKSPITGRVFTYYAQNGMVKLLDELTGGYRAVFVRDALCRAAALSAEAKRTTWPREKYELQRQVQLILAACQEARHQGDPALVLAQNFVTSGPRAGRPLPVPRAPQSHLLPPLPAPPADKPLGPQVTPDFVRHDP